MISPPRTDARPAREKIGNRWCRVTVKSLAVNMFKPCLTTVRFHFLLCLGPDLARKAPDTANDASTRAFLCANFVHASFSRFSLHVYECVQEAVKPLDPWLRLQPATPTCMYAPPSKLRHQQSQPHAPSMPPLLPSRSFSRSLHTSQLCNALQLLPAAALTKM